MTAHKLSLADEAVITAMTAKQAELETEIEYLRNELASMRTGPHSDLLKENRNLRHELAVLVHGIDAESERLREQLTASQAREAKLREALEVHARWGSGQGPKIEAAIEALALPHDDTALKEYGKREYERGWDDGHIAGREKISGLKEYRKKVLLEAAEHCNKRGYGLMGHEISMMAEEE